MVFKRRNKISSKGSIFEIRFELEDAVHPSNRSPPQRINNPRARTTGQVSTPLRPSPRHIGIVRSTTASFHACHHCPRSTVCWKATIQAPPTPVNSTRVSRRRGLLCSFLEKRSQKFHARNKKKSGGEPLT